MPKSKVDVAALKKDTRKRRSKTRVTENSQVDMSPRIGFQLKRERCVRGLRLKDVAEATGLSQSFISKIENNKVSPSLSTLHRIAKALGTGISAVFAMDETLDRVVHHPKDRPVAGKVQSMVEWDGIQAEIMVPYVAGRMLEGFVFIMQPGGHSGGVLRHEGEECGYVLEGELELVVGGETNVLKPGDSFFFHSDLPHSYRNPGKVAARVIWINTPPTY
ncbi:MAG: cupin domain-containing protein [Gammaproteobacteria bacterium]|nr:cupin domain-containing protein [Gammaproteobacteria bacterium]